MADADSHEGLLLRDPEAADSRREVEASLARIRGAWEARHPEIDVGTEIRRTRNRLLVYYLTGEKPEWG